MKTKRRPILSDVGDAIRFMHDQGVIHLDPQARRENLLLAGQGARKLTFWRGSFLCFSREDY